MKTIIFITALLTSMSFSGQASKTGVSVKRVATTVDGLRFLYINSGIVPTCDRDIWGTTYGAIMVPTGDMYGSLLTALNENKPIRLLIIKDDAGSYNIAWTNSTPCRVEYADLE